MQERGQTFALGLDADGSDGSNVKFRNSRISAILAISFGKTSQIFPILYSETFIVYRNEFLTHTQRIQTQMGPVCAVVAHAWSYAEVPGGVARSAQAHCGALRHPPGRVTAGHHQGLYYRFCGY